MFLFRPNAAGVIDTLTRALVTLINVTYSVPRWISRQMLYCYAWAWKYRYSVRKNTQSPSSSIPWLFSHCVMREHVLIGDENDFLAGLFTLSAFYGVNLCSVSSSWVRRGWDWCEVLLNGAGANRLAKHTHASDNSTKTVFTAVGRRHGLR